MLDRTQSGASPRRSRWQHFQDEHRALSVIIVIVGLIAILIGGEGSGLPAAVVEEADDRVTIPMQAPVESLNAAVATALVLYEARRQRDRHGLALS